MATPPNQTSDPYAAIATPIQSVASTTAASADPYASIATPDSSGGVLSTLGDVGKGFVKGAGDTVSGVSHLINKIPVVGETLAPSQGISALDQMDTSQNTAQSVGKGVEGIAEFAAGDEALSGLAKGAKLVELADKYPIIAKTLNLATQHPWLAKVITEAGKGATTGAVEGAVKGAQKNDIVGGAVTGAERGAVGGAAGGALSATVKALPPNPFRKAAQAMTGSDIQPKFQQGIRDVWNAVADQAGVPQPKASSIQDIGQEVGDSILARSKANYRLIDDATGNRFSATEQALKSVNQDLRSVTNDAEEQALSIRKTRLELQMDQMMDDAETKGVDKAVVDAAKSDFKKAQAIYDTNHQIRMSVSGVRPGMQGAEAVPEEVNSKSLMNRLNKLYNKGRLQQAVGDDGAEDLIGHSAIAQKAVKDVAKRQATAKFIGQKVIPAATAAAATAGAAYEGAKAFSH